MNDETVTDALLREFLLGKVTDEVRERIEGQFVTDPQARERVLAVEQDLIEDYLEGTLSADEREQFVAGYTQTPEQRRKLRITKSIKDWAMTEAKAEQTAPTAISGWSRVQLWLRPTFVVPVAVMVLIVIVVAAFWLSRRAGHSAIEKELAQLNAPSNTTTADVKRELSPVTVRSAGTQAELNPRPASGEVELRLLLTQSERYASYTATIHRVGDRDTYSVPNLIPSSDGKAIHLRLPSHLFVRGLYQIIVTPDAPSSSSDEYQLTVGE